MNRRRPLSSSRGEAAALLVVLTLQGIIIAVDEARLTGGALVLLIVIALSVRVPLRKVYRAGRAILVILLPVLLLRLVADPSLRTAAEWSIYLARLLTAVLIALLYLHLRGGMGLRRALYTVLAPLPDALRSAITDMIASTFHLTPILIRRLAEAQGASRVRLRRTSRLRPWRPYAAMVRSFLISVGTLPRARAEAMVVRGLIGRHAHAEGFDETA